MKLNELLLLYISENTLIYDLVDIIGMNNTLKLVSVFGGETITIPSRETIKNDLIDVIIYTTILQDPENQTSIDILSNRFSLTSREIKKRFKKASKLFEEGGVSKKITIDKAEIEVEDIEQYILEIAD
jgi:hypothetical protein